MAKWRFIHSGSSGPAMNMAVDEAIVQAVGDGLSLPTLRFYGWNPRTLSIGYFQKAEEEVDFQELRRRGIGFVRRPTGGRAVLHHMELTYSLILPEHYPGLPQRVTEAYRMLSEGLLFGFRHLGLQAEMVNLSSEAEKMKYASGGSAVCFDSPSWYELVVEGRKVAGSAQTRQKGVVLQHGSILLDLDADELFAVLKFPSDRIKERLRKSFSDKAVAINDVLRARGKETASLAEVESAFRRGFSEALQVELIDDDLSDTERKLSEQFTAEKYENHDFLFRR